MLALPGGGTATGREQIRAAFARLVAGGRTFTPGDQQPTLHAGDLALTSSRLGSGGTTVEVARRQPDGAWLIVLDNPDITG